MSAATAALLGGVIGAVLSTVLNFVLQCAADRRQWVREDLTRHHQERLSAYRKVLAAVSVERFGFVNDDKAMGYWLVESVLEQATKAVGELHSEVLLLSSSPRVREASDSINTQALLLRSKAYEIQEWEPLDDEDLGKYTDPLLRTRSEFLAAAREELGIEAR